MASDHLNVRVLLAWDKYCSTDTVASVPLRSVARLFRWSHDGRMLMSQVSTEAGASEASLWVWAASPFECFFLRQTCGLFSRTGKSMTNI